MATWLNVLIIALLTGSSPLSEGFATDRVTFWCASTNGYSPKIPCFEVSFLPIDFKQQLSGAQLAVKVKNAIRQMRYLKNGKIFVHCEHGQDRTGLVVACYRVQAEGWSKAKAEKEMFDHGFHKILHGLWEYWESVPDVKVN